MLKILLILLLFSAPNLYSTCRSFDCKDTDIVQICKWESQNDLIRLCDELEIPIYEYDDKRCFLYERKWETFLSQCYWTEVSGGELP